MTLTSIGDLAGAFANRIATTRVKADLARLNDELSTGRPADPVAHLGGDTARLALIEREIDLARARSSAATGIGQMLATMQDVLGHLDTVRGQLADQILAVTPASTSGEIARAGEAGAAAFRDIVSRLNTAHAGRALFAGTAMDGPPLADADAMLASISAAVAGATTATDVTTAIDAWFDDPAGGFATMGYLGDTGATLRFGMDEGAPVSIAARADHPALKDLLRMAATVAIAGNAGLGLPASTATRLIGDALPGLLSAAAPLTDLRAGLGLEEQRLADAVTRLDARAAALTIQRNDLALVDPYATAVALQATQTQLDMQFTLTARLSGLNLVNYLR